MRPYTLLIVLFTGCTTVRPLSATEVANAKRDTLVLKTITVTNPVSTVEVAVRRVDTVFSERVIKEVTNNVYLDTAQLASYLDSYRGVMLSEMAELQNTIVDLQILAVKNKGGTDSAKKELQLKLNTTKQEKNAAQAEIKTNNTIIYEIPKYIYIALLILALLLFIVYRYLKRRLGQKINILKPTHFRARK